MKNPSFSRPAFSIVELMVSIGIIGVLFAIAMPALMGARLRASELQSLANARSIAAVMQAYADTIGHWPFQRANKEPPHWIEFPILPEGGAFLTTNHFEHDRRWPGLVAFIAPWEEHFASWVSPGREDTTVASQFVDGVSHGGVVSYIYSHSFVASPALWSGSATADPSLIAPTRPADVAFPSSKVLVWDSDLAYLPKSPRRVEGHWFHPTLMAFADGHAAVHNPLDAAAGVPNPLNNNNSFRLHNTPGGVQGRDY